MINLIVIIVANIILGLAFWYSDKKSKQILKKELSGSFIIKANPIHKISGFILIIIAVVLINIMILNWNEDIQVIATVTACLFLIPGILLIIYYYNYNIEFNEVRVIITNWRGTKKIFKWSDIVKVKFIDSLNCLYIKANSSKTFINQDCVGFISFIEMMELKTNYKLDTMHNKRV